LVGLTDKQPKFLDKISREMNGNQQCAMAIMATNCNAANQKKKKRSKRRERRGKPMKKKREKEQRNYSRWAPVTD